MVFADAIPNTSTTFGTNSEFYVQFRQRWDVNALAFTDNVPVSGDGIKQYILTLSDRYIDERNWATMNSCTFAEIVQVDQQFLGYPSLYYACGGTKDLHGYQDLSPHRGRYALPDILEQSAQGCVYAKTSGGPAAKLESLVRRSDVVTVTMATALGLSAGDTVWIDNNVPIADPTSASNTPFSGVFTVASVIDPTEFTYRQNGVDQSTAGGMGIVRLVDFDHCWRYEADEWETFQLHVKIGSDYRNDHNYRRDSVIEMWAAHQNQPSELVNVIDDFDILMHDYDASLPGAPWPTLERVRPNIQPRYNWWKEHNLAPGYGRMDLLFYMTDRCPSTRKVASLARSGGVATVKFDLWANGAGNSCVQPGAAFVISDTTADGGSFNGKWVAKAVTSTSASFAQDGHDVAPEPASGLLCVSRAGSSIATAASATSIRGLSSSSFRPSASPIRRRDRRSDFPIRPTIAR